MENLLVILEQLISHLGSDIIDKNHTFKNTFLQNQSGYIKPDLINIVPKRLAKLVSLCDIQLLECCHLTDLLVDLKGSLKNENDLSGEDYIRLLKCEVLIEEFKRLLEFYKELIQKIADLGPAI